MGVFRQVEILCVGEVLWDALPEGLFLGGAPFNVACHLRAAGVPATMVSRVGDDRLGEEVIRRAERYGGGVDLIQVDPALPTGFVRVAVDDDGNPAYDILAPNYRTVQKTADLTGFWKNTYPEVKKELKRRYPKHPWP